MMSHMFQEYLWLSARRDFLVIKKETPPFNISWLLEYEKMIFFSPTFINNSVNCFKNFQLLPWKFSNFKTHMKMCPKPRSFQNTCIEVSPLLFKLFEQVQELLYINLLDLTKPGNKLHEWFIYFESMSQLLLFFN